ncbi:MAG: hypothetical protein WCS85_03960 [Candidatus Peribacteraceae bacterium]|jgi:hypothetical protein
MNTLTTSSESPDPEPDVALPPQYASPTLVRLVESMRQQGLTCFHIPDGKTVLTLDGHVHPITGTRGKSPVIEVPAHAIPEGFEPAGDGLD